MLQQYLPFTVLKLINVARNKKSHNFVATVLTVYGIETIMQLSAIFSIALMMLQQYLPFTVLKLVVRPLYVNVCIDVRCNSTYRLRY